MAAPPARRRILARGRKAKHRARAACAKGVRDQRRGWSRREGRTTAIHPKGVERALDGSPSENGEFTNVNMMRPGDLAIPAAQCKGFFTVSRRRLDKNGGPVRGPAARNLSVAGGSP
eukprot:12730970-Alexandrium_andersonii.AAC.1